MISTREQRRLKYTNGNRKPVRDDDKIRLNLDIIALNLLGSYVLTDNKNVRRSHLVNLSNILDRLDMRDYENDNARIDKINIIRRALEGKLNYNIKDIDMLIKHINGGIFAESTIDPGMLKELSNDDLNWINSVITDSLKYGHFYEDADKFIDVCSRLKSGEYGNKKEITEEFESLINQTQTKFRKAKIESHSDMTFSLRGGICEESIRDLHSQLTNPSVRLLSGMKGLNEMTGGGFESGRVYMFFGLPGEGKSTTLLNLVYQIKKHNKNYKTKDPTKCPCIVLLTMENTVRETVERLFTLSCNAEEMEAYNVEDVINMIRTEGELYLNDNSPIDIIIKFKPDRSVDTSYLYELTEDLEDDGYEVICLVQDYVKRIRSIEHTGDLRIDLGAVVNEYKNFAAIKDIPVISASQLNRDATKHVDEARQKNRTDLVRLLGRSNIGESMLMLENVDCSFMITPEYEEDRKYMGIQRIKIRYKAKSDIECIYQPFEYGNGIKFVEDEGTGDIVYKTSMRDIIMTKSPKNPGSGYMSNNIVDLDRIGTGSALDKIIENNKFIDNATIIESDNDMSILDSVANGLIKPVIFSNYKNINPVSFI